MTGKIEKIVAHDIEVFADLEMDNLRRERCLCLNCQKMSSDCSVSKDFIACAFKIILL